MNKTLMIVSGVVIVVILIGGYLFLGKSKSSTNTQPTQMEMTPAQSNSGASEAPVASNKVTIENFAYSPATITVKIGDTVTWTNNDSAGHSATADDSSWDTGVFSQGESKTVTFSKAGTFTYHCSVHPNMKGTVIVQ